MEDNQHICPICGSPLQIADSKIIFEGDNSPDTVTRVFSQLKMVCTNATVDPKTKQRACSNYCGPDLSNPIKVVEIIKNPIN